MSWNYRGNAVGTVITTRIITTVTGMLHAVTWREWEDMNFLHLTMVRTSDTADGLLFFHELNK